MPETSTSRAPVVPAPAREYVIGEPTASRPVRRREGLGRWILALCDLVAALAALVLAVGVIGQDAVAAPLFAALPLVIVLAKVVGLYDRDELVLHRSTLDEAPRLFQLATLFTLLVWLGEDLFIRGELGHSQVLGIWMGLLAVLLLFRRGGRWVTDRLVEEERCLLLGQKSMARRFHRKLELGRSHARLVGHLPVELTAPELAGAILDHRVHRVLIAPGESGQDDVVELVQLTKALGVRVSILPRVFEVIGSSVEFDDLEGLPVLGVRRFGLTRSSELVKRTLDIVGSLGALVVAAPLFALITLAIRLDSSGPLLFRQQRVGRDGRLFEMFKFRTMDEDAEARKDDLRDRNETEGLFKIAGDPRITRIGRLLRRSSLDELPQLLNVFRGEMSLVGPRPLVVEEDSQVEGWHRRRLHLTPGMTGHWQILGSARIPLQEMVKIDYLYAANWTLWADVKILLRTMLFVLGRRGL